MRRTVRLHFITPINVIVFTLLLCSVATAASITGGFGTTAAGVITFANAANTAHFIDWCPVDPGSPTGGVTCPVSATGKGDFIATGGSGSFAAGVPPFPTLTPGTIKDMVDSGSVPPFTTFPPGVLVSINNFVTVSTLPQFNFRAEFLDLQSCSGNPLIIQCIGPFILTQVGNNVAVSMSLHGTVLDTTNTLSPARFDYVITGQFNNTTISAVAVAAQTTGGIFSNSWSGSVSTSPLQLGNQGCTPGFWKQSFHFGFWSGGYFPGRIISTIFTGVVPALASESMLDALQGGGGQGLVGAESILLRAAVSALLNASNPNVSYAFSTANIISAVNAALATGDRDTILQLATLLDNANNGTGGCPLSGQTQ